MVTRKTHRVKPAGCCGTPAGLLDAVERSTRGRFRPCARPPLPQNEIRHPTRTSLPITMADGRPSDEPIVVTALVTALLWNRL